MTKPSIPLDPLKLDPRAISILIAVGRYPNGATVNKLTGSLAMSYRTIRGLCEQLTALTPPLLAAKEGVYTEYSLHPAADLSALLSVPTPAEQTKRKPIQPIQPDQPIEPKPRPPKQPHRKRANLVIDSLRVKRLSLDPSLFQVFIQNFKDGDSLSTSIQSLMSAAIKDQGIEKQDFRWFKNVRVKNCLIDELTALPQLGMVDPADHVNIADQTSPSLRPSQPADVAILPASPSTQPDEEPKQTPRKYSPPDTSRKVNINLPNSAIYNALIINDRRLDPTELNPRHTQQYLLHAEEILEHAIVWHPHFAVIQEGLVLGWLAQALEGYQRGKITQPWGIVYRGLLGELPNRYPDKRFRDRPEKLLPSDWLIKAGWEVDEADLPPTPEEEPHWKPSGPQLTVFRRYDEEDDDDDDDEN